MIILLSGTDSYRIREKLNKYREKFTRDIDSTGINIEILDGSETTIESFHKAVLSGGLFVKKRLVIIKNLFSQVKDKDIFLEIENYIKKNQDKEDIIIIFIQAEAHKQQSSKLFKSIKTQKFSEDFQSLAGIKLNNWIRKQAEACEGKINPQAVQFLANNIGSDLWRLSNEINKLIAYKSGGDLSADPSADEAGEAEIGLEDVQQFVKTKLDENIFNLTDAFGRKNKAQSLKLISDQIGSGSAWPYILTMFARQIKIIFQIKSSLEAGFPQYPHP